MLYDVFFFFMPPDKSGTKQGVNGMTELSALELQSANESLISTDSDSQSFICNTSEGQNIPLFAFG